MSEDAEDKDSRKPTQKMKEAIILAKLYKDGFLVVDQEAKTAEIDMRKSRIVELYTEESYDDVKSILKRTADGLDTLGYEVKLRYLDGLTDGESDAAKVLSDVMENGFGDGFVGKPKKRGKKK